MNDVVVYQEPPKMAVIQKGENYIATGWAHAVELEREVDFGKAGNAKTPTLRKPGAEKVLDAYGVLPRYALECAEENHDDAYFFYRFRCDAVKLFPDGREFIVESGWGSANTKESRNGSAGGWNAANNAVKMAKKRAMVDAAVSLGKLSGMFTQDMENDEFMNKATTTIEADGPEAFITAAQVKRIFAIGGNYHLTTEKVKNFLTSEGHPKAKEIKQKDYNDVCGLLESFGKNGGVAK
jgi:hypothetical protein